MGTTDPRTIELKTGGTCTIRVAERGDAEGILACTRATLEGPNAEFNVLAREEFTLTVEDEERWIGDHREKPGWIALVADVDGAVVGLINFKNGQQKRLAHQGSLGMNVHPDWRGRGIGDGLLAALLDWARGNPRIERVGLAVVGRNDVAQGLYRKHGFVEEGRHIKTIKYDEGRYDDNVVMYVLV